MHEQGKRVMLSVAPLPPSTINLCNKPFGGKKNNNNNKNNEEWIALNHLLALDRFELHLQNKLEFIRSIKNDDRFRERERKKAHNLQTNRQITNIYNKV